MTIKHRHWSAWRREHHSLTEVVLLDVLCGLVSHDSSSGRRMTGSHCWSPSLPWFNFWLWQCISSNFFLTGHTLPTRPEPVWQKMVWALPQWHHTTCGYQGERVRSNHGETMAEKKSIHHLCCSLQEPNPKQAAPYHRFPMQVDISRFSENKSKLYFPFFISGWIDAIPMCDLQRLLSLFYVRCPCNHVLF